MLNTKPNLIDADGFYAELIRVYESLDESEIQALSARLILILANHAGDDAAQEALKLALDTAS